MPEEKNRLTVWFTVKSTIAVLLTGAAVIGALYGAHRYINSQIDVRLQDAEFLNSVASLVRPELIFNSQGSIIADMGALQHLESIKVVPSTNAPPSSPKQLDARPPSLIIVTPKKYLSQAPMVTLMDPFIYLNIDVRRGQGLTWEYEIKQAYHITTGEERELRFRLEILH